MPSWTIKTRGEATEHYGVEADTEDEARAMFERGDVGRPIFSEVNGSEIVSIERDNA